MAANQDEIIAGLAEIIEEVTGIEQRPFRDGLGHRLIGSRWCAPFTLGRGPYTVGSEPSIVGRGLLMVAPR